MRQTPWRYSIAIASACLLLLLGCLGPSKTSPTRLYVLDSLYHSEMLPAPVADLKGTAIGVGPIRIPGKIDRSKVVTRTSQNEIRLNENAEWADPLGDSITRVLAENLSILLHTENISIFPWLKTTVTDYQVTVDVIDFIGTPGGDALLRAWWTVFAENGRAELFKSNTTIKETVAGDNISAMIKTQSRTLGLLSRHIAEAIKALSEGRKPGTEK